MDNAEPSANNISAMNLHRLASILGDESYAQVAKETVQAFEAEVAQWPFTFPGMLGSVVLERLGVKGIIITGRDQDEKEKRLLRKLRHELRPGQTVVRLSGEGGWLRGRNKLLADMRVGGELKVMVCEKGACREGKEYLEGL